MWVFCLEIITDNEIVLGYFSQFQINYGGKMMVDEKKKEVKNRKKKLTSDEMQLQFYNELLEKKAEVDKKLKPLKKYLEAIGLLPKPERKKKV